MNNVVFMPAKSIEFEKWVTHDVPDIFLLRRYSKEGVWQLRHELGGKIRIFYIDPAWKAVYESIIPGATLCVFLDSDSSNVISVGTISQKKHDSELAKILWPTEWPEARANLFFLSSVFRPIAAGIVKYADRKGNPSRLIDTPLMIEAKEIIDRYGTIQGFVDYLAGYSSSDGECKQRVHLIATDEDPEEEISESTEYAEDLQTVAASEESPVESAEAIGIDDDEEDAGKPRESCRPMTVTQRIEEQLRTWKNELINLDRRNRLLYYKPTKASTVEFVEPAASNMLDKLYASNSRGIRVVRSPGDKPDLVSSRALNPGEARSFESQSDKLAKCLHNLERNANQLWLDRGIWSLYLGCGMLEWKESNDAGVDFVRTPILMVPVELDHAGGTENFRIQKTDEEMALNPALVAKMNLDFDLDLSIDEEIEEGDLKGILESVRTKTARKGWRVLDSAVLASFTFHKHAMYKDLDTNAGTVISNPILRALVLGKDSGHDFEFESLSFEDLDHKAPPEEMVTILDADSSQRQAIVAAREGRSYVLDGPPGTGKSQTIANIIAELIANKKSVLFVSEKAAALEVVKKRLDQAGLSDFIMELHSHKATRKEVARNLGIALAAQPTPVQAMARMEVEALRRNRLELYEWGAAVNETRPDLGISLQEAIGRVASNTVLADLPPGKPLPIDGRLELRSRVHEAAEALSQSWGPVERHDDFIWDRAVATAWDASIRTAIVEKVDNLLDAIGDITAFSERVARRMGIPRPLDIASLEALSIIERLLENRPEVSPALLADGDTEELDKELTELATRTGVLNEAGALLDRKAGRAWRMLSPDLGTRFSEAMTAIRSLDAGWLPNGEENTEGLWKKQRFHEEYAERINTMRMATLEFSAFFIMTQTLQSVSTARQLCEFGKTLESKNRPEKFWISKDWLADYEAKLREAHDAVREVNDLATSLAPTLSESVIHLDLDGIKTRFASYGFGRIFTKSYHYDMKALSAHSPSGKFRWRDRSAIAIAHNLKTSCARLDSLEPRLGEFFGAFWKSRKTDFEAIGSAANLARIGFDWFMKGFELAPLRSVLSGENPEVLNRLGVLTETLTMELVTFDARIELACPECRSLIEGMDLQQLPEHMKVLSNVFLHLASMLEETRVHCPSVRSFSDLEAVAPARLRVDLEEQHFSARKERLAADFLAIYKGPESDWVELKSILGWVGEMRTALGPTLSHEVADAIFNVEACSAQYDERMHAFNTAFTEIRSAVDMGSRLGKRLLSIKGIENLQNLLKAMRDHVDEITEAQRHYVMKDALCSLGLSPAMDFAVTRRLPANTLVNFLDAAFLVPWIEEVFKADKRLKSYSPGERNGILASFQHLDRKYVERCASVAITACASMKPADYRGGWATIQHQAGLQKRHKPVKKLMEEAGAEIRQLKPCFMMSPLSVSQFIPPAMKFDAVIFDEASQVRPADAINSIYRGGQLIVAGDQRQLPPTRFFEQSQDSDDDYSEDDEPRSWESILDLCTSSASFKELQLLWHYRSRHEHLIAFSNHSFYDGRLVTFPGALHEGEDVGVEFFHVPDGQYRRNATRDNLPEAHKVRDRVLHHIEHHPDLTIGIVALSERQAALIEQILEASLADRPSLMERMKRDRLDGLFIKNLETVQGDERDLIILSIGYGPDETGRLTQNFGPMNHQNGWRRLNVAVTRARKRVEVVSSILPNQITDGNGVKSIRHLKRYLEYAAAGNSRMHVVSDLFGHGNADRESPFEDSVAHAIVRMGYSVEPQHGCSGYRIDLAVRHPADPTQFVLAVECDGARYHSVKVVRDRDRLRQEILQGLGWTVHRIWSSAWYWNRKEQERLLEEAIKKAISDHPVRNGAQEIQETGTCDPERPQNDIDTVDRDSVAVSEPEEFPDAVQSESQTGSTSNVLDEYPSLPKSLTVEGLVQYLNTLGIPVENHRATGGGLWVYLGERDFGDIARHLRKSGVGCRYYLFGRKNHPGEQFELDPEKKMILTQ